MWPFSRRPPLDLDGAIALKRVKSLETDFELLETRFLALRGAVSDDLERSLVVRNRAVAAESSSKKQREGPDDAPGAHINSVEEYKVWVEKNGRRDPEVETRLGL